MADWGKENIRVSLPFSETEHTLLLTLAFNNSRTKGMGGYSNPRSPKEHGKWEAYLFGGAAETFAQMDRS